MLANRQGRPADAASSLRAVLHDLTSSNGASLDAERGVLRCNVLITLALSELLTESLPAAEARLDEAQAIAEGLGDVSLMARVAFQRGTIHGRVGDLSTAWREMQVALAHRDAFSLKEQVAMLLNQGMLSFELARPEDALAAFVEAGRLAKANRLDLQHRMARHNEGYAVYLLGDLPRALAIMESAEGIVEDQWFGTEVLDRGRVLLEAGLVAEAVQVLTEGAARTDGQNRHLRAEFDLEIARAHRLQGRLDQAATAAASSRAGYEEVGATAWAAKARVAMIAIDLDRHRRGRRSSVAASVPDGPVGAVELLAAGRAGDELAATASRLGDAELVRSATVAAAEAFLAAGDVDAARERISAVGGSTIGSLVSDLSASGIEAEVLAASADPAGARRVLVRSARRLAAAQEGSASLDLRTATAVHGVRLARLDLQLALPRGPQAVLESLERWRSATDRLPSLGRPADDRLAALTEQLRSAQMQLRGGGEPQQLEQLRRKVGELERAIRARDWSLSSETGDFAAIETRVREGRAALTRADRDLVWFFGHEDRLMGVGVVGGRAVVRDLMGLAAATELAHRVRVDLRTAATMGLGPFRGAVWGSLASAARELDDRLLRPWRAKRSGIVLVTCQEISALPWALMPSLAGCPVTLARSLTSFARREAAGGLRPRPSVHVSVGPHVPRGDAEGASVRRAWTAAGARVPNVGRSSAAGLVQAMSSANVVHVAAHGIHQVQSPLFSSLALHDGPVFAHELQASGVGADHVVLSACDVGSAVSRPGEEQLGMAAAVHSLGARSVVAAVSPVPDDVAAAAMARHHEALASGVTSDEALAMAIAATDPVAAAFVHLGGRFTLSREA